MNKTKVTIIEGVIYQVAMTARKAENPAPNYQPEKLADDVYVIAKTFTEAFKKVGEAMPEREVVAISRIGNSWSSGLKFKLDRIIL